MKKELNFHGEVKWSKVTAAYLAKYVKLIEAFFEELKQGNVKVRIMFSQNARRPIGLTNEQLKLSYWLLYYQFVKHAFGFEFSNDMTSRHLRLYFDQFPDTGEQASQFKGYIHALEQSPSFQKAMLKIRREDIAEVRSHEQCFASVFGTLFLAQ